MASKKNQKKNSTPKAEKLGKGVVRHLSPEEGWRFLYVRKGEDLFSSQHEEIQHLNSQVKVLRQSATLILDKAASLEDFGREVTKRIQAQQALWDSGHAAFRKQLNLPENAVVTHNPERGVFEIRVKPPAPPPPPKLA